MYPILFDFGYFKIGAYGVLLAAAFISGYFLVIRQFKKFGGDIDLAWDLNFLAIFGGLVGSRILFIIENINDFFKSPVSMIASTTGFSVLGGYIMAFGLCYIRIKKAKESSLRVLDLYSPSLALGYCIGRLGCIMAGDGCYGIPTDKPWGMTFPNGIVSTLSSSNSMLVDLYIKIFPGKPVPENISVHPTPLYESLLTLVLFFILLLGKWDIGKGRRFALFLVWFGVSRFFIEFIRLNPFDYFGMTSSQVLSIFFVLTGIIIFFKSGKSKGN